MGTDRKKLTELDKKVMTIDLGLKESFYQLNCPMEAHGIGWDGLLDHMGRFFRPISSYSEPWYRPTRLSKLSTFCFALVVRMLIKAILIRDATSALSSDLPCSTWKRGPFNILVQ